jgi:hypothetical protein
VGKTPHCHSRSKGFKSFSMYKNGQVLDGYPGQQIPYTAQPHWVHCKSHKYLAFIDNDGKWRAFYAGKELPEVSSVFATE